MKPLAHIHHTLVPDPRKLGVIDEAIGLRKSVLHDDIGRQCREDVDEIYDIAGFMLDGETGEEFIDDGLDGRFEAVDGRFGEVRSYGCAADAMALVGLGAEC